MAARRPPHRRWLVRRRRLQDTQAAQVTHIWLRLPRLPMHIRTWRSSDRRVGAVRVRLAPRSGTGVVTQSILLVLIAINIAHDIMTSQWLLALFDCLVVVPA